MTPATATADAAFLDFSAGNDTLGNTRVDEGRSAGFRDSHIYCVAPVLSPEQAGARPARVEYWAVGVDCCQGFGSFTCDSARDWRASKAVVLVGDGFPCANCHAQEFQAAVKKAEA